MPCDTIIAPHLRTALARREELLPVLPKIGLCLQVDNLLVTFFLDHLAKWYINKGGEGGGGNMGSCCPHSSKIKCITKLYSTHAHTHTHRDMDEQKYRHLFRVKHISSVLKIEHPLQEPQHFRSFECRRC